VSDHRVPESSGVIPAERAVPFYCPYCGEEDLEPTEADGEWRCRSCVRRFRLRFAGAGAGGIR